MTYQFYSKWSSYGTPNTEHLLSINLLLRTSWRVLGVLWGLCGNTVGIMWEHCGDFVRTIMWEHYTKNEVFHSGFSRCKQIRSLRI